MGKHIQLNIADPCHENWDNMTQAEQGRFCASCQKQVVDFTNMSDSQLAVFFKKPAEVSVCGRFFQDQLERDIEIPKKRIPWVKYFFQFALPAFLVSMKANAQNKVRMGKPLMTTSAQNKTREKSTLDSLPPVALLNRSTIKLPEQEKNSLQNVITVSPNDLTKCDRFLVTELKGSVGMVSVEYLKKNKKVKGVVVDEDNNPVPFASVIVKGTKIGTTADGIGQFEIKDVSLKTNNTFIISSVGYEPKELKIGNGVVSDEIVIHLAKQTMREVVVVAYGSVTRKMVTGTSSVKTERNIINSSIVKSPTELPAMIKVYPNPVASGTNINIGCQKLEEGYYVIQLSSQSGQQVLTKQTWIDGEVQVLNIDIPNVASGVYFLKLTNKETSKRFTQKIIVQ